MPSPSTLGVPGSLRNGSAVVVGFGSLRRLKRLPSHLKTVVARSAKMGYAVVQNRRTY